MPATLPDLLLSLVSIALGLVAFLAVLRLFRISADLTEIRKLLERREEETSRAARRLQ